MIENTKSPSVDVGTLANLLSLTAVRIQQLATDGVVIKSARGKYDLWPSIRGYIKYLQERRVNQWDANGEEQTDIKREQLRRTKEEADKLELQNARTRGELTEVARVKTLGGRVMVAIKGRILNFPITDEQKDKCLVELMELGKMDWSDREN
jgi:phage terminase Nu1 subunit (DNA packaging protein)